MRNKSRSSWLWVSLLILTSIITACVAQEADEGTLPTLAMLPSPTDTPEPTETVPAWTPVPTETDIPTSTPQPTETATHTPTMTVTLRPTNTAVPPATATHTLTPPPTSTFTPIAVPTSGQPVIIFFTASQSTASTGATVTLTWEAQATSARLETLNPAGALTNTISVPVIGSTNVVIPGGESSVIYRLVATVGTNQTSQALTINIATVCSVPFFFGTAPADAGCPPVGAVQAQGHYQRFERGVMFRVQFDGLDKICGIQNDRNRYACYNYAPYNGTPSSTPPSGFFPPAAEVANVFYNQLAIGGFWSDVIGWGTTAGANTPMNAQRDAERRIYLQLPIGVLRFDADLNNGPVERIN